MQVRIKPNSAAKKKKKKVFPLLLEVVMVFEMNTFWGFLTFQYTKAPEMDST